MRAGLFVGLLCFGAGSSLAASPSPSELEDKNLGLCVGEAKTDSESAGCFEEARAAADRRMNSAYAKLRKVMEPGQFAKLQASQRRWIAFRDADREAMLAILCPNYCGTLDAVVIAQSDYSIVKDRADQLERMLASNAENSP